TLGTTPSGGNAFAPSTMVPAKTCSVNCLPSVERNLSTMAAKREVLSAASTVDTAHSPTRLQRAPRAGQPGPHTGNLGWELLDFLLDHTKGEEALEAVPYAIEELEDLKYALDACNSAAKDWLYTPEGKAWFESAGRPPLGADNVT